MFPKIKKKIQSFLADETGTISKRNLIKGAIAIGTIGATVRIVKGEVVGDPMGPVSKKTLESNNANTVFIPSRSDIPCSEVTVTRTTWFPTPLGCTCGSSIHGNSTLVHKNGDKSFHKNALNMTYDKDVKLTGKHAHHGQHCNADEAIPSNMHSNHCSHCSHGSHCSSKFCL